MSQPPFTLTIKTITINSAPLVDGIDTISGPVTIYPLAPNETAGPVLISPGPDDTTSWATVEVEVNGTSGIGWFSPRLWLYMDALTQSATPQIFGGGLLLNGDNSQNSSQLPATLTFQMPIASGPFMNTNIWSILPSEKCLMGRNLRIGWNIWFNGQPTQMYFPWFTLPNVELYITPPQADPPNVDDIRLWVARDMAAPFISAQGSNPTGQQIAAACVNTAWQAPPVYDIAHGASSYFVMPTGFYLQDWLCALNGVNTAPALCNCSDTACFTCLVLEQQESDAVGLVWGGQIVGWLPVNAAAVRGIPNQQFAPIFGWHQVTVAECPGVNGPFVCDATMGPYPANYGCEAYFQAAFTSQASSNYDYWQAPPPGGVSSQWSTWMPTPIDGQAYTALPPAWNPPSGQAEAPSPSAGERERIADFAAAVGTKSASPPGTGPIGCAWPNPHGQPGVPETFRVTYGRLHVSHPVSDRYWTLADGDQSLHVRIWVASGDDASTDAFDLFHRLGAAHSHAGPIFAKGPDYGDACGTRTFDGGTERLWVRTNIVFRVTAMGNAAQIDTFCAWLDGLAAAAGPATLPLLHVAPGNATLRTGEKLVLTPTVDRPCKFAVLQGRPALRQVGGAVGKLTFVADRAGDVTLRIIATDPETLISAEQPCDVSVETV